MTTRTAATARERIPLNTLAIPFGLSGLAETWTAGSRVLSLPDVVADVFWLLAGVAWIWMITAHLIRGVRVHQPLAAQLRHPAQGPIAALVPVVGMLLGARVFRYSPTVGESLVVLSIVAAALFAGWIIPRWLRGIEPSAVHGGYLLPTVASGLIGGTTAAEVGLPDLGWGAFAIGILFWAVLFTILVVRLGALTALPGPLTPTLAILVAPPAVAGLA